MNNRLPYIFHHRPPRSLALAPVFGGVNPAFLLRPQPPPSLRPVLTVPGHHHHPKTDTDHHQQKGAGLQIRGLSPSVGYLERDHLLYGLGATTVHNAPFYSIAFFANEKAAQAVIRRLHQQPWAPTGNSSTTGSTSHRLLRVEYLKQHPTKPEIILNAHRPCDLSLKRLITAEQEQCFNLNQNSSSSSPLEVSNSLPKNFCFPPATPTVVRRISRSLLANDRFYEQVLLLMLRLGLHPPFDADNPPLENSEEDSCVHLANISLPPSPPLTSKRSLGEHQLIASDESELESESEDAKDASSNHLPTFHHPPKRRKRKRLKTGLVGEKAQEWLPKTASKSSTKLLTTTIEEAFEGAPSGGVLHQRDLLKIKVAPLVSASSPPPPPPNESQLESKSSFGTLSPQLPKPPTPPPSQASISFDLATLTPADLVSEEELTSNLLPRTEWPTHKVFAGYRTNPVCNRLYVKNLHRSTSLRELYRLFGKFIGRALTDAETLRAFNIVKLDRGRMRGQAFVTFPTEEAAQEALARTNGYVLHRDEETARPRPIVVNFALSKKSQVESTLAELCDTK